MHRMEQNRQERSRLLLKIQTFQEIRLMITKPNKAKQIF